MSTTIRELEPKEVWNRFADINAVPRPSKKEQKITAFMVDFGKKLGLETTSDAYGNVIIRKPATAGLEHKKPIILQSHLDMVCQKNNDTVFDFDNQGIETYIDGDWLPLWLSWRAKPSRTLLLRRSSPLMRKQV